ncbi:MAG TPA: methyl-accepting chemotaxis protein [Syntrophales bacterium]|nr:methyl-accepting chemotaxis protein [Syntrophales bacterium]HRT70591.1 methyl-accepting chemotaxis protein [Syntrophales bacterium]
MKISRFFSNLSISKKLLLAPLVILLFLVLLSVGAYMGLSAQKVAIEDIYNNRFKGYQNCARVMSEITNVHANVYKVISWAGANYEAQKIDNLAKGQIQVIERNVNFLREILKSAALTPEEKRLYQAALDQLLEYQKPALGVLDVASADLNAATMFMGVADEKFQVLNKSLEDLLALENRLSKEKYDYSLASFNRTLQIFVALFVVAVLLSLISSIMITRLISRSIHKTIEVIQKVADGDLTGKIDVGSEDELGRLAASVNAMQSKMGGAVGQSLSISQVLSESASEQAASLEETSASLDEMASMTRQTAAHTAEANTLMNAAKQAIEKANSSMNELTDSMKVIAAASEQTQHIVKSIDEIAFQTNLLALNAAVEAARAGEAGAGFAVVADEVRNLAMRATESAKNTAGLIDDIVRKVKGGEALVNATSGAFGEVKATSNKVLELTGEIAAASKEQSEGINQVNKAVAEMNRVTQQNAASAQELASVMSMFRTGNGHKGQKSGDGGSGRQHHPVHVPEVDPEKFIPMEEEAHF